MNYTELNCVTQKIKLKRNCASCPILTPWGPSNTTEEWIVINGITITWDRKSSEKKECDYDEIATGVGTLTKLNTAGRLVDEINQLEFLFNMTNVTDFCNTRTIDHYQVHAVLGLTNTFLSFSNYTVTQRKERSISDDSPEKPQFPRGMIKAYTSNFNCLTNVGRKLELQACPTVGLWQSQATRESKTTMAGQNFQYNNEGIITLTNSSYCLEAIGGTPELIKCSFTYKNRWIPQPFNRTVAGKPLYKLEYYEMRGLLFKREK